MTTFDFDAEYIYAKVYDSRDIGLNSLPYTIDDPFARPYLAENVMQRLEQFLYDYPAVCRHAYKIEVFAYSPRGREKRVIMLWLKQPSPFAEADRK